MKSLQEYIQEQQQTQSEILQDEVSQILKPFGSVRDGFKKKFDKDEVDDLMQREGWEFDHEEEDKEDGKLRYIWKKQDFECHIYVDPLKEKIFNFNIFS